jgi:hypothetical protein
MGLYSNVETARKVSKTFFAVLKEKHTMATSPGVDAAGVKRLMDNCEYFLCTSGWAPNPPAQHIASKLARLCFHGADTRVIATFWLWRDNGEENWHLVPADHWAPLNTSKGWQFTLPLDGEQMCKVLMDLLQ